MYEQRIVELLETIGPLMRTDIRIRLNVKPANEVRLYRGILTLAENGTIETIPVGDGRRKWDIKVSPVVREIKQRLLEILSPNKPTTLTQIRIKLAMGLSNWADIDLALRQLVRRKLIEAASTALYPDGGYFLVSSSG